MGLSANRSLTIKTFKASIPQAMSLPANKIIAIKHPFHIQWASGKQNYHYKTTIPRAMGLPANKIITIKHPFYMQWAC